MKNNKILIPIIIVSILALCTCSTVGFFVFGNNKDQETAKNEQPEKVEATPTATTSTSPVPTVKEFKVGEKVEVEGIQITVFSFTDYTEKEELYMPEQGYEYKAVEIEFINNKQEAVTYNVLDFTLRDSDGFEYEYSSTNKNPFFGSGDLQSGKKVRGFVVYEVKKGVTGLELTFDAGWWTYSQIIFRLS
jgi:hypothetical protein